MASLGDKVTKSRSSQAWLWPVALLILASVMAWPSTAAANVLIPMIMLVWPLSWFVFVPVVAIETLIARLVLHLTWRRSLRLAAVANAWSTLAGIPLTWGLLMIAPAILAVVGAHWNPQGNVLELLVLPWSTAALSSYTKPGAAYAGAFSLCVPFFFASVWIEARVARRSLPAAQAHAWAWRANFVTYAIAAILLAAGLSSELSQPHDQPFPATHHHHHVRRHPPPDAAPVDHQGLFRIGGEEKVELGRAAPGIGELD